MSLTEVEILMV